jgi:hypothetical protein
MKTKKLRGHKTEILKILKIGKNDSLQLDFESLSIKGITEKLWVRPPFGIFLILALQIPKAHGIILDGLIGYYG